MLSVSNLRVQRGDFKVLHGIQLTARKGALTSLVGANGAGKSTLMDAISGLIRPSSGKIQFEGADITALPPHRIARLGLIQIPEGRKLFPEMTVMENLVAGSSADSRKFSVAASLEEVFHLFPVLQSRQTQAAKTLSGGEQQMVAIGRGLMGKPKQLMLDEPSLGLAPLLVRELFHVLTRLNKSGLTVLLVEQNLRQSLRISDYAYVVENGVITGSGTGAELLNDEHTRKAFLGM